MRAHKDVTDAVHEHVRSMHADFTPRRYAIHLLPLPSKIAPIGWFTPKEPSAEIERDNRILRQDRITGKAERYDGVEVMGSEGYLINEFIAARTNKRTDEWEALLESHSPGRRNRPPNAQSREEISSSSTGFLCLTSSKVVARGRR